MDVSGKLYDQGDPDSVVQNNSSSLEYSITNNESAFEDKDFKNAFKQEPLFETTGVDSLQRESNMAVPDAAPIKNQGLKTFQFPLRQPFNIHSYPLTNPPIIDSTMMLAFENGENAQRRRRISISNGQIGQIVNHEALILDHDMSPYGGSRSPSVDFLGPTNNDMTSNKPPVQVTESTDIPPNQSQPYAQVSPPRSPKTDQSQTPLSDRGSHPTSAKAPAGVPPPNHSLIYNNEIIYNPNNGPIPGTAAWKKERLLERNRIAASRCRQRKKQAQQQLQDTVNNLEMKNKDLSDELEVYKSALGNIKSLIDKHKNGCPHADDFEVLDGMDNQNLDEDFIAALLDRVKHHQTI
ncbi:Piso0_000510 [Millerozyma farinosa CBS 7064]|uniref:Piso0_000510 protein n=1 Tax=Pichia sorbitophila (strain ATCC MYA-4447 / BCRC 22081 / CBS 7064 / NBRC 10061 / NRRL Y-12695) TaxID=559304 RepID=G8YU67_PICSO|nr:Piso0_000510 [Millerozyma farinosa CBS 7064]CCE73468.1 Piso0_000510 [Millerozyma farinosa CBS 7064]